MKQTTLIEFKSKNLFQTFLLIYVFFSSFAILFLIFSKQNMVINAEELTVKRINIIEENGKNAMVISNQSLMPLPILGGKEYPRSIQFSGIAFYDSESGDEAGGIGIVDHPTARVRQFIFDYSNSEAISFGSFETKDGSEYFSGIGIRSRVPLGSIVEEVGTTAPERISIFADDNEAGIQLNDGTGRPRLLMSVDSLGEPSILKFDSEGNSMNVLPFSIK